MLTIDESQFPFIVVEIHQSLSLNDVDVLFDYLQRQIDAQQTFALAFRPVDLGVPNVAVLKHIAAKTEFHREGMTYFTVCIGMHISSAALRGALKFVSSISRSSVEHSAFATWTETEAWVRSRLREAKGRSQEHATGGSLGSVD